ncbi:MAG TPA: hypothetical protein VMM84_08610 [Pyrinomonadaceae bacterium]|nr:hypothetical protein [Pyrinomonadaceae bacterium]
MEPNYVTADYWLAIAYETQGLYDLSVDAHLKSRAGMNIEITAMLKDAYAKDGWRGFCRERLAQAKKRAKLSHFEPYYMALDYLRNSDKEQALQWLEKAYESRSSWIPTIAYDPLLDSLRSDSRFQDLIRRAGLPQPNPS